MIIKLKQYSAKNRQYHNKIKAILELTCKEFSLFTEPLLIKFSLKPFFNKKIKKIMINIIYNINMNN